MKRLILAIFVCALGVTARANPLQNLTDKQREVLATLRAVERRLLAQVKAAQRIVARVGEEQKLDRRETGDFLVDIQEISDRFEGFERGLSSQFRLHTPASDHFNTLSISAGSLHRQLEDYRDTLAAKVTAGELLEQLRGSYVLLSSLVGNLALSLANAANFRGGYRNESHHGHDRVYVPDEKEFVRIQKFFVALVKLHGKTSNVILKTPLGSETEKSEANERLEHDKLDARELLTKLSTAATNEVQVSANRTLGSQECIVLLNAAEVVI